LLKSVKNDGFEWIFGRFYPIFEQKSVKIRGLKSFWIAASNNIQRTFSSLLEILIFKINLITLTIKSHHEISTVVRRDKTLCHIIF